MIRLILYLFNLHVGSSLIGLGIYYLLSGFIFGILGTFLSLFIKNISDGSKC